MVWSRRSGAMPLAPSLDTIGLLARGAADLLPLATILADLPAIAARSGRIVVLRDVMALCTPRHRASAAPI